MKFRPAPPANSKKRGATPRSGVGIALALLAGAAVVGGMAGAGAKPRPGRRQPDAATNKMFSNIHRNRERFSAGAVRQALAKAKAAKVD